MLSTGMTVKSTKARVNEIKATPEKEHALSLSLRRGNFPCTAKRTCLTLS